MCLWVDLIFLDLLMNPFQNHLRSPSAQKCVLLFVGSLWCLCAFGFHIHLLKAEKLLCAYLKSQLKTFTYQHDFAKLNLKKCYLYIMPYHIVHDNTTINLNMIIIYHIMILTVLWQCIYIMTTYSSSTRGGGDHFKNGTTSAKVNRHVTHNVLTHPVTTL